MKPTIPLCHICLVIAPVQRDYPGWHSHSLAITRSVTSSTIHDRASSAQERAAARGKVYRSPSQSPPIGLIPRVLPLTPPDQKPSIETDVQCQSSGMDGPFMVEMVHLEPILGLQATTEQDVTPHFSQHSTLNSLFDGLLPNGPHHSWKADFVEELTDEALAIHAQPGLTVLASCPSCRWTHSMAPCMIVIRRRAPSTIATGSAPASRHSVRIRPRRGAGLARPGTADQH